MDINSINNNNINLSTSSSLQLDRANALKPQKTSQEDGLVVQINDYNKKRDELSLNIQSLNDGIATSTIAQKSLDKQQQYLQNIQDKLSNVDNFQNKNDLKQSITEDLKKFSQTAYETKYKDENLLISNNYDEKNSLEISTNKDVYSIEKVNTADYANKIFEAVNNTDLSNPDSLNKLKESVKDYSNKLKDYSDNFTNLQDKLKEDAKSNIKEQIDLYNQNVTKIKDFGKESADFSKNNVNANIGYLVASQANIVQAQSVKLLS